MRAPTRLVTTLFAAIALCAMCAATAAASGGVLKRQIRADAQASAFKAAAADTAIPVRDPGPPPGAQVLKYKFGPMTIRPGQNLINVDIQKERPAVDGWIVGFRPGLTYAGQPDKNPPVDEVHLHHAVWLVGDKNESLKPTFAAGEEKTYINAPTGFGWRYQTDQTWILNHMIHDLTGQPKRVDLTYTLYFIPDSAPEAANITRISTQWMDVQGIKPYPVFNALKGSGTKSRFTYPDQDPKAYSADGVQRNKWTVDRDVTLVSTAGHLHPGGLWNDLDVTRDGKTVRLFRSRAQYFDPAGAISWDVSMSATAPNWRVALKAGDVLSTNAVYDTSKASWYEVMGIMVAGMAEGHVDGAVDPFDGTIDQTDYLTHGRLKENIDRSPRQKNPGLSNPLRARQGPYKDKVTIKNFVYSPGDLSLPASQGGLPPTIRKGQQLTFVNKDAPLTERFHTITACKAPCNLTPGIGYPLANGRTFDSGELGYGPSINTGLYTGGDQTVPITAVVNVPTSKANCKSVPGLLSIIANGCVGTTTWKTPKNLSAGTYAYFCRIHPFMRGAFRVKN